jgi:hypothetical protein
LANELEEWDSEMESLVTWLDTHKFPSYPFEIGEAVQVVGDKFFDDLKMTIDRCEYRKDLIPDLRYKLKRLKSLMEATQNKS